MRGAAIPNFARSSRPTIAIVSRTALRVIAAGTSFERQVRGDERDAQRRSRAPPTSSITTRGVCVRSARNSVWPENGMPASISTLFCTGAVTSAAKAPVAHASAACSSIASTLRALAGSGCPARPARRAG